MIYQKTLKQEVEFRGKGLHTGVVSRILIKPAESNTGIIFRDVNNNKNITKAHIDNVCSTLRGTTLQNKLGNKIFIIDQNFLR